MTDPLAHLYAETGYDDPEDNDDLPVATVTIEDLVTAGPETETLSDHDLEELVVIVKARIDAGTMDDNETVELGLGEFVTVAGTLDEDELILNNVGRAVFRRLVGDQAVEIGGHDGQ